MIEIKLTDKQKDITRAIREKRYGNICLYGGAGSGKTFYLFRHLLQRAAYAPKSHHLIIRKAFSHAKGPIIDDMIGRVLSQSDEFARLIEHKDFNVNHTDGTITLPNGSKIYIRGLDQHKVGSLLGSQYTTIFYNECSELDYDSIQQLVSRVRIEVPIYDSKGNYLTTMKTQRLYDFNPPLKTHWTYKVFKEKKCPVTGLPLPNADDYFVGHLTPRDNQDNLASDFIQNLEYAGGTNVTRFLEGEFQDEIAGALFTAKMILKTHECEFYKLSREQVRQKMSYICIGVDPAVTSEDKSDLTGIIVCGHDDNKYYVLEDASGRYHPEEWAAVVARLYRQWNANKVVVETNQGGELLRSNIQSHGAKDIWIAGVRAREGKRIRAEPVATLYAQDRVYHIPYYTEKKQEDGQEEKNGLVDLEYEMQSFTGAMGQKSPDRLDALVHALQYITESYCGSPNIADLVFTF